MINSIVKTIRGLIRVDFISSLKSSDRLKVEVTYTNNDEIYKAKVTSADTVPNYLESKILGTTNKITVTKENAGANEDLKIGIGTDVFDKSTNTTDNITEGSTKLFFTDERAQDAVGNALIDSGSIDFTYNDALNSISAVVLPAGVNHNALSGYVANQHIDHSAVSTLAGSGLVGGGDLTGTRTISMPPIGTSGTYGSASSVPVLSTDAQGRVTSVTNTPILITESQVTNLTTDLTNRALTATQVIAGSGLTGGGALSGNVTLNMPAVGTSGTYGSGTQIPVFTTDAQGRVASVTNTALSVSAIDHNSLANLTNGDPHTQYAYLAGRSTGQVLNGGVAANATLTLNSTSNGTKGKIFFGASSVYDDSNQWLGINTTTPRAPLHVVGMSTNQIRGVTNFHYSTDTQSSKACFGKARGTPTSPSAVNTSDVLANYTFFGYGTTDFIQGAAIRGLAQQTFSDSAAGTNIEIQTAATGATGMQTVATFQSDKQVVFANNVRLGTTIDSTNGNVQYATTNTEFLGRENGTWKNLTITPTIISASGSVTTTSATYAVITSMTTTPVAGTYLVIFTGSHNIGTDTNGDFSIFVNAVQDTTAQCNVAIDAAGVLGAAASQGDSVTLITTATVNGSQAINVRFRENGGGTLGITTRKLIIIPISR